MIKFLVSTFLIFLSALFLIGCSSEEQESQAALRRLQSYVANKEVEKALLLADTIQKNWATNLKLQEETLILSRKARAEQLRQRIIEKETENKKTQEKIAYYTEKIHFLPETAERSAKYTHPNFSSSPSKAGNILYASCDDKGFLTLTDYYIGVKSLDFDAIGILSSFGEEERSTPLAKDGALRATFANGGLYHSTLQLTPHDSRRLGDLLFQTIQKGGTIAIQRYNGDKKVGDYTLSAQTLQALEEVIALSMHKHNNEAEKMAILNYKKGLARLEKELEKAQ